jgi:hypothetical protein
LCAIAGFLFGGKAIVPAALLAFLPMWLIGAGVNMYMGVKSAGYSVAEEMPMFFFVFGVPAIVALALWWYFR